MPITGLDKIEETVKTVTSNTITYHVKTMGGDRYLVIQRVRLDSTYEEAIYFVTGPKQAVCLRRHVMPINRLPEVNFERFIEGDGVLPN